MFVLLEDCSRIGFVRVFVGAFGYFIAFCGFSWRGVPVVFHLGVRNRLHSYCWKTVLVLGLFVFLFRWWHCLNDHESLFVYALNIIRRWIFTSSILVDTPSLNLPVLGGLMGCLI